MASISASVGSGGVNNKADVVTVQKLLNQYLAAQGELPIATGGTIDPDTILTIQAYQSQVLGIAGPDGRIDPGGRTWKALDSGQGFAPLLSGAAWWHANEGRFPTSRSIDDLAKPFRDNTATFVKALRDAGATVTVSATYRHPVRAHLMHYCVKVAKGEIAPNQVPAAPDCAIRWDHGDLARSKKGAQEMADLFGIVFPASLTSLHIFRRAIDMTIGWNGTLTIKDATGKTVEIGAPRNGNDNVQLHKVGATYKVMKLATDPPHWSDNGH
jgi:hypothetical protein